VTPEPPGALPADGLPRPNRDSRRPLPDSTTKSFDRIAQPYRFVEWCTFGGALQRTRTAHIAQLDDCRRILILGEGDGRFLQRLCARNPRAEIHVVERSARMIQLARRRARNASGATFFEADALTHPLNGPYDAVVTAFFLDCFEGEELNRLLARLTASCAPSCTWLYADFHSGRSYWSRLRNGTWIWLLYRAFGLTTDIRARRLADPLPTLAAFGWRLVDEVWQRGGLLRSAHLQLHG